MPSEADLVYPLFDNHSSHQALHPNEPFFQDGGHKNNELLTFFQTNARKKHYLSKNCYQFKFFIEDYLSCIFT